MRLSTKGRYAVRAMLDLALQPGEAPILIRDISQRQEISELYLEQLFTRLKAAGLLRSIRGPKGGFLLSRHPSQIRVIDIVEAMEGTTALVECVDDADFCSRAGLCVARQLWTEVKEAVDRVLESLTLQDLTTRQDLTVQEERGSITVCGVSNR
jgi:Rrf2 family cysteine metabolism transcriptional repressor